jgi:hypothetical protein
MDSAEVDLLAREVDALAAEIEEERFRHVAGLEPEPALARLFAARPRVAHRDTVAALRAAGNAGLASRVAALRAERAQAEDEEAWREQDSKASAPGPDGPVALAAAERALLAESDRARCHALARAAAQAAEAPARRREAAAETRARARAEGGLLPDWEAVVRGDEALAASDDAYRDVLAWSARRELGLAPRPHGDLSRADLLHLLALARWDGLFREGMLPVALVRTWERLGLDLARVAIDDAPRPARWNGAHVLGPRVAFGRRGGAGDWQDLFRAAGEALANAHHRPHRRDPVLAAAIGAVLAGLLLEPRFLAERAEVERRHAADLVRDLALRELLRLRASAAALRVAVEVERGLSGAAWREAHREALASAALASWEGVWASRDVDAPALAASLAGAGAAARLREELRDRYDEDWWRNPRTAAHLAGLLAAGSLPWEATGAESAPAREARWLASKLDGA